MARHFRHTILSAFGLVLFGLVVGCGDDQPAKPKLQARDTIGKWTQEVRNLKPELAKGGQTTDGKIHATDYITLQADAYRTNVAKIAKMKIEMDIRQYEALKRRKAQDLRRVHGRDHQEGQARRRPAPDAAVLPRIRLRPRQVRTGRDRVP